MVNNLEKWPKKWNEHIVQACELYFSNKKVNFLEYNQYETIVVPNNIEEAKSQVYCIKSEFEYNGKYFIIYIEHLEKYEKQFSIHCCYKSYDVQENFKHIDPIPSVSVVGNDVGYDEYGFYAVVPIAGQSSFDETPYTIIQIIEDVILNYGDGWKDDDNDGGEDPVSPDNPIDVVDVSPSMS